MTTTREGFGARVLSRRSALGLTQVELARRVGVSFTAVNAWERGRQKPGSLAVVERAARELGVSASWLAFGDGEPS